MSRLCNSLLSTLLICTFTVPVSIPLAAYSYNITKTSSCDQAVIQAVDDLVEHPFAAPHKLFKHVYTVKSYAQKYCGKQFNLPEILIAYNEGFKKLGWQMKENHLNSLVNYLNAHHLNFEYNRMSVGFDEDEEVHVENHWYGQGFGYVAAFEYYSKEDIISTVKANQEIADYLIDEVPPGVTLGTCLVLVGHILSYTPYNNMGNILKGVGASFIGTDAMQACTDMKDKRREEREERENGYIDIRKPQPKQANDIRQRPIGH